MGKFSQTIFKERMQHRKYLIPPLTLSTEALHQVAVAQGVDWVNYLLEDQGLYSWFLQSTCI